MIRLAIAVLAAAGLASAPHAVEAKKHRPLRRDIISVSSGTYGSSGLSTMPSGTYGSSGPAIGTVTAPSVGSYYWPSVGVTNAVPTWSNTNPPVR